MKKPAHPCKKTIYHSLITTTAQKLLHHRWIPHTSGGTHLHVEPRSHTYLPLASGEPRRQCHMGLLHLVDYWSSRITFHVMRSRPPKYLYNCICICTWIYDIFHRLIAYTRHKVPETCTAVIIIKFLKFASHWLHLRKFNLSKHLVTI